MIDELGTLTFKEVHERTNAIAHALRADGVGAGDGVAIMCRNHRGLIDAGAWRARSSAPTRCSSTPRSPARS